MAAIRYIKSDDDGRSSRYAYAAAQDAKKQFDKYFGLYTQEQIAAAIKLQDKVFKAMSPKMVHLNPRKAFLAVSADHPNPCATQQAAVARLLKECEEQGIECIESANHMIFRMYKKKKA
jgi:hypothetical protein